MRAELHEIMGISAAPRVRARRPLAALHGAVHGGPRRARWPQSKRASPQLPGLHLAGNAYDGIGIPDCIRMGKQAAEASRLGHGAPACPVASVRKSA